MRDLFRSKFFLGGLALGLLACVAFNLHSFNQLTADCADCYFEVGWPFTAYEQGTILHLDDVSWSGLIANVVSAWLFSVGSGLHAHLFFRLLGRSRRGAIR